VLLLYRYIIVQARGVGVHNGQSRWQCVSAKLVPYLYSLFRDLSGYRLLI
jgi:hypothetical protein